MFDKPEVQQKNGKNMEITNGLRLNFKFKYVSLDNIRITLLNCLN